MERVPLPDGGELGVHVREGVGVPFLLLPGLLERARAWDRVAARLHAAGRRVLVVEPREVDWTPQAYADDALRALRALAPEGAHVVGHSRGGAAAGWMALEAPGLVRSLAVVASPPLPGEPFRAHFRRRIPEARSARERAAFTYLAQIPDDDFPGQLLRQYRGRALVVEVGDDPLYSPTHTMFWRLFLPFAAFERVEGGHRFFAEDDVRAAWLAERLLKAFP